jgi:hypothetical protein
MSDRRPRRPGRTALVVRLAAATTIVAAGALAGAATGAGAGVAPERGVAVVLEPVSGRVFVHPDGVTRYRRLGTAERMPVGTTVDAKHGAVRLTVARNDRGDTWTAVFSEGKFTVLQPTEGEPVTTLRLTGPSLRDTCGGDGATASAARKRKRVRRLWGDGKGRFRTSGHYSAATVRGTRWLTEDRCDGTLTKVTQGRVEVFDFVLRKRIQLRAGQSYLAKPRATSTKKVVKKKAAKPKPRRRG